MVKRFMWPQARQNFCKLNINFIWIAPTYRRNVRFEFTILYYVYLVAQVSSKNFAKLLLLFQIPKDTVFSYAGAPLSNVRVAFLKTLLFSARQFLCLSTPLCLLYLQIIKNGLLLMKLQCKGS